MMDTAWVSKSLQMLKPVLSSIALSGGYVLFGTSTERYRSMMDYAGAYCGMPHISDVWRGGALTNKLQLKKRVDLVFVADISSDYAIYIETQKLRLPSVFMHHFNSRLLPTYSLPGPITWESVFFYANVLSYFVKAVFFVKEILPEKLTRKNFWSTTYEKIVIPNKKYIKLDTLVKKQKQILVNRKYTQEMICLPSSGTANTKYLYKRNKQLDARRKKEKVYKQNS